MARLDHFTALYEEQAETIRELKALLKTTQDELKEALEAQASFNAVTSENQAANEKLAEQVKKLQSTVDGLVKLMGAAMSRPTLATVAEGLFVIILCIEFETQQRAKKQRQRVLLGMRVLIVSVQLACCRPQRVRKQRKVCLKEYVRAILKGRRCCRGGCWERS